MTLLASWAAIDTHGISSAYIVSDSRISWGNKKYFDFILELYIIRKDFYWEWKSLRNLYIIKLNGVMKILNYAMEH